MDVVVVALAAVVGVVVVVVVVVVTGRDSGFVMMLLLGVIEEQNLISRLSLLPPPSLMPLLLLVAAGALDSAVPDVALAWHDSRLIGAAELAAASTSNESQIFVLGQFRSVRIVRRLQVTLTCMAGSDAHRTSRTAPRGNSMHVDGENPPPPCDTSNAPKRSTLSG